MCVWRIMTYQIFYNFQSQNTETNGFVVDLSHAVTVSISAQIPMTNWSCTYVCPVKSSTRTKSSNCSRKRLGSFCRDKKPAAGAWWCFPTRTVWRKLKRRWRRNESTERRYFSGRSGSAKPNGASGRSWRRFYRAPLVLYRRQLSVTRWSWTSSEIRTRMSTMRWTKSVTSSRKARTRCTLTACTMMI